MRGDSLAGYKRESKTLDLSEIFLGALVRLYIKAISWVPWPWINKISKLLAMPLSFVPWSRRAVAISNIKTYGGDLNSDKELYRKMLSHFIAVAMEMPGLLTLKPHEIRQLYTIEGREHILEAFGGGKGILLLTAHFGNWELLNTAFAIEFLQEEGYRASVIARSLDSPTLELWANRLRTRFGTKVINKQNAMRGILRALRENQAVGILLDQNVDWYQGVFVRFFGGWACTNRAMAQIALKTGAPVIPAFALKQGDRYLIRFYPPLKLHRTGDLTKDVEQNTQLFTSTIEEEIRRHPEQWLWFHRRWKTKQYWPFV